VLTMNALYAEIERKRKMNEVIREKLSSDGTQIGSSKFVRHGDRKRLEELELEEKQRQLDSERAKRVKIEEQAAVESAAPVKHIPTKVDLAEQYAHLSPQEVKDRLRRIRQPITLFGENGAERLSRLLEHMSGEGGEALDDVKVGRNISDDENEEAELEAQDKEDANHSARGKGSGSGGQTNGAEGAEDDGEESDGDEPNSNKVQWDPTVHFSKMPGLSQEKVVYKFFRALTKQWEADLNQREEWEKRSAAGKKETKTQKQCKDYIRPLFRMCKKKEVPFDILDKLALMVKCCEEGNFLGANDQYIR
jgi:pre-mRNA-splicing factor 18